MQVGEPRNKPTHLRSIIYDKVGKNIQWRKDSLFNTWCWENWTATCKSMKLEHCPTPYTKINLRWFKNLNIRHDTLKLLEENIGKIFWDINHSSSLLDQSPKAKEIKANINKWDLVKLKNFCTANNTINRTKRLLMEWKKIFANDAIDKGLVLKILKHLIQLNIKKQLNKKIGRRPKQTFLQRRHTDG